jgi:mannan endo-1,4-beta-mannosidase
MVLVWFPMILKAAAGGKLDTTRRMAFIQADGTRFTLANEPFYFMGSNTYYLTYKSKFMVDAVLDGAKSLGFERTIPISDLQLHHLAHH